MAKVISLICPNCSAPIDLLAAGQFRCEYCDTLHTIVFDKGERHSDQPHSSARQMGNNSEQLKLKKLMAEIDSLKVNLNKLKEKKAFITKQKSSRSKEQRKDDWKSFIGLTTVSHAINLWFWYALLYISLYNGWPWWVSLILGFTALMVVGGDLVRLNDEDKEAKLKVLGRQIRHLTAKIELKEKNRQIYLKLMMRRL